MSNWQPIETAPGDGTVIDVWLGNALPEDVAFYCSPGSLRSPDWAWRNGKFRPVTGLISVPTFVQPTHWMPIPKAPQNPGDAAPHQEGKQ